MSDEVMAEVTEAHVTAQVEELKQAFADGFQWEDVRTVIKAATEFADVWTLKGSEKRALALRVLNRVIDETDTPWLPDFLVDPLLKRVLPGIVDLVVEAAHGKLKIG